MALLPSRASIMPREAPKKGDQGEGGPPRSVPRLLEGLMELRRGVKGHMRGTKEMALVMLQQEQALGQTSTDFRIYGSRAEELTWTGCPSRPPSSSY